LVLVSLLDREGARQLAAASLGALAVAALAGALAVAGALAGVAGTLGAVVAVLTAFARRLAGHLVLGWDEQRWSTRWLVSKEVGGECHRSSGQRRGKTVRLGPLCSRARCCSRPFARSPFVFSSADQKTRRRRRKKKSPGRQRLKPASKTSTEGSFERARDVASPGVPLFCLSVRLGAVFLTFVLSLEYVSRSFQTA